jgi:class 3 adenylate cyclase/pimeloyl-ACP methyl ester carboxylesterase
MGASGGAYEDRLVDEIRDADLTVLLDAAGCERVVFVGVGAAGLDVIRYTAAHPERVAALVLINSFAHYVREDDYPWGLSLDDLDRFTSFAREVWGTGGGLEIMAPSKVGDEGFRAWYARSQRLGLSVDQVARSIQTTFLRDVRALLPKLDVPTLVLHRAGDRYITVGAGRILGEHISGASYVELPGDDDLIFVGDIDALLDEIEEFLTGSHQAPEGDLVMAAILFTDIVASTEQSARMGHRKWTTLTDNHDAKVRTVLQRHRGCEVKTLGDGFLATFDTTTRAVHAAMEIVSAASGLGLEVRAGVHAGEVEVRPDDVVGLSVSIAKRICDLAAPGTVLVSKTVKGHIVGSGIAMSEQGTHALKGVPETWRLFAVDS